MTATALPDRGLRAVLRYDGRPSIRRSLVLWLVLPLLLLVPATAILFYQLALAPALDSLDHSLDGTALEIERLVKAGPDGQPRMDVSPELDYALRADRFDDVHWALLAPDGSVVAGDAQLAQLGGPPAPVDWRFADANWNEDDPVRVAMHSWTCVPAAAGRPAQHCEARVAETLNKRRSVAKHVSAAAASAMLVEALILAMMGWFAIARSLKPMERLSKDIEQRSPEHLGAVDRPDIPLEVAPLVTALNGLFARVVKASAAEKAFIADAAHQLRTPLTALRTETELALLETHPAQVEALLRRLHMSTTRSARLANQLLSQARAEHTRHNSAMERLDLKQIVVEAAEEWVPRSVDAGVDLGFELESARVEGHGFLLRELLANLLDNAINYAGNGARITVRTALSADDPACAVLEVEDNGPGIPPEERERAFERFQRGRAGGPGSGLGLSIVRDIAAHHRARAELLDGEGGVGLRVRITFPALDAAPRAPRPSRAA